MDFYREHQSFKNQNTERKGKTKGKKIYQQTNCKKINK